MAVLMVMGSGPVRRPWAIYYADQVKPERFRGYDLLVFEGDRHPALGPIRAGGATVLGYLSICELEQHRESFADAKQAGLLLGANPDWPASYFVDVRDPRWRAMVVRRLAPAIAAQGFQGFFLDTVDDAADLERRDPVRFHGMKEAAVMLVREIRQAYPEARLMVNRGYEILPQIAATVDIVLGESVYGTYDFAAKTYRRVPEAEYRGQTRLLGSLRAINPALRVCTLDYWDPVDVEGIRKAYREERSHGFEPYVATISLDQLIPEPR